MFDFIIGLIGLGGMLWYGFQSYKEMKAGDLVGAAIEGIMIVAFFIVLRAGWL